MFADAAKAADYRVYAAAYLNQAEPGIENRVEMVEWLNIGEVERLIDFFRQNRVTDIVIIGWIRKPGSMFSDIKPDATALSLLAGLTDTHDDTLLRSFANLLESRGFVVRSSTFLLPDVLADEGCWTKRTPTASQWSDIEVGWRIAKEIGRLDIGQCVVVQKGSVLAVEAIEGTDAAIIRGGSLGGGDAVVVKVCKPNQDTRFDVPAVGLETVKTMHSVNAFTLAIEAGKAVVFEKDEMVSFADEHGMSIVALKDGALPSGAEK